MSGDQRFGKLGIGDKRNRLIPTKLTFDESISQVSCGDSHTAFLTKGGNVYMCGSGILGQLGTGDTEDRLIPAKLMFVNLANEYYETRELTNIPPICQVNCGAYHTALLTKNGDAYMCGSGSVGQLGTKRQDNELIPKLVRLYLSSISQVSCGYYHTVFLTKDGDVYVCGRGTDGRLGTGDGAGRLIPTKLTNANLALETVTSQALLKNLPPISQISCGAEYTAFLTKAGNFYVCGNGKHGRLGTGDERDRSIPTKLVLKA